MLSQKMYALQILGLRRLDYIMTVYILMSPFVELAIGLPSHLLYINLYYLLLFNMIITFKVYSRDPYLALK